MNPAHGMRHYPGTLLLVAIPPTGAEEPKYVYALTSNEQLFACQQSTNYLLLQRQMTFQGLLNDEEQV